MGKLLKYFGESSCTTLIFAQLHFFWNAYIMSHPWGLYSSSLLAVDMIVGVFWAVFLHSVPFSQQSFGGERMFSVCINLERVEFVQVCSYGTGTLFVGVF